MYRETIRKTFWILWMTVWPAVALIPPLVRAQAPRSSVTSAPTQPVATVSGRRVHVVAQASSQEHVVPAASPKAATGYTKGRPQADRKADVKPQPDPFAEKPEPASKPDPLGSAISATKPRTSATPGVSKNVRPSPVTTGSRTRFGGNQIAHVETSEQEARAQELIHERAMLRASNRHSRMELKQWGQQGRRPLVPTSRWSPQMSQHNPLFGSSRSSNP